MKALLLLLLATGANALEVKAPSPNSGTITPTAITAETGSFSGSVTVGSMTVNGMGGNIPMDIGSTGNPGLLLRNRTNGLPLGYLYTPAATAGMRIADHNASDIATFLPGPLVGIGTASPCSTCTLHVAGGASVTGALTVANNMRVGGTLYSVSVSSWSTGETGEIIYAQYTLPANSLAAGDSLYIECVSTTTGGTWVKNNVPYFGTTRLNDAALSSSSNDWHAWARVMTISSTAFRSDSIRTRGSSITHSPLSFTGDTTAATVISCRGAANGVAGDMSGFYMVVRLEPAP